ncbi:MAG: maleylpyruvate isomerase family mycothiol-dependent enzyme, partial [Candidatus Dormibacteria bacterium]
TADLRAHVVNVLRQKLPVLRGRLTAAPGPDSWPRADPTDTDLPSALQAAAEEVVTLLREIGPEVGLWSWFEPDRTSSFWARRLAHEMAIHAIDSELARGLGPQCDPQLAADGVGELVNVFLARPGRPIADDGPEAVVHLHGSDIFCEWSVGLTRSGMTAIPGHPDSPEAELRGPVASLYLWGWGRGTIAGIDIRGDEGLPRRLRELAARAT